MQKVGVEIGYCIQSAVLEELSGFLRRADLLGTFPWSPSDIEGSIVVALDDGRVIGAARLFRYWLHPARWRLAIHVESGYRRRGIGSALLGALVERLPADGRELQVSVDASDRVAIAFLRCNGFQPLMTTRIGTLNPADVPPPLRERARSSRVRMAVDDVHIVTLAERPDLLDATVAAHQDVYRDQHRWNPPVDISPGRARDLFLNPDELEPAMQFLAIHNRVIIAIASLRTTSSPDVLNLGWVGVVGQSMCSARPMYDALLGACVDAAAMRRAVIEMEVDRVDPDLNAAVDALPVSWGDDWLTFGRVR